MLIEQGANEVKARQDGKQVIFDNQDYLPIDESKELPALLNDEALEKALEQNSNFQEPSHQGSDNSFSRIDDPDHQHGY